VEALETFVSINEWDISQLLALYRGEFDNVQCSVCPAILPAARGVALSIRGEVLVVEPIWKGQSIASAVSLSGAIRILRDLNQLRKSAWPRLVENAAALQPLDALEKDGITEPRLGQWLNLTPEVFAGAALIIARKAVAPKAMLPSYLALRPSLSLLGQLEGLAWSRLALTAARRVREGARLQADLETYIRREAVLPEAMPTLLTTFRGNVGKLRSNRIDRYCAFGVIAWACDAVGAENPMVGHWAEAFFDFEIAGASATGEEAMFRERARLADAFVARSIPASLSIEVGRQAAFRLAVRSRNGSDRSIADRNAEIFVAAFTRLGQSDVVGRTLMLSAPLRTFATTERFAQEIVAAGDPDLLIQHAAILAATHPDRATLWQSVLKNVSRHDRVTQARAEASASRVLNDRGRSNDVLKQIGEAPRLWEELLPLEDRATLWMERSNALHRLGRLPEALTIACEVERLALATTNVELRHHAIRNAALLLRDTGAPGAALERLESVARHAPANGRAAALESLGLTYALFGRFRQAADTYARGRAQGILTEDDRARLIALEAVARAAIGQDERALSLLAELSAIDSQDRVVFIYGASAWLALASTDPKLAADAFIERLQQKLAEVAHTSEKNGEKHIAIAAATVQVLLWDACGDPRSTGSASATIARAAAAGVGTQPALHLILARAAFHLARKADGLAALDGYRRAAAAPFTLLARREDAIDATGSVRRWFEQMAREVKDDPQLLRLLSEIRRDTLAYIHPDGRSATELLDSLSDSALARLAPTSGRVCILDWADFGSAGIEPMLTVIADDAKVTVRPLKPPDFGIADAAAEILRKLQAWADCYGDVFAAASWRRVEDWLRGELALAVNEGDHLVFIEDPESAGLPWHVAAGRAYSASYASSWSSLLEQAPAEAADQPSMGVLAVPFATNGDAIRLAFSNASSAFANIAAAAGIPCKEINGPAADRQAGLVILETSWIAAMLCHGVVEPQERSTSWAVAENGLLPSAPFVSAVQLSAGRQRLRMQDIELLARTPQIVVTAACSSGIGHFAGLGQRLGLFRPLRRRSTRSFVAPRWKSHAPAAGRILADMMDRHIRGGEPLGWALRLACCAAEDAGLPRRHAWNFGLEGDWM
jgi:tetratricopeptide (TPR) repeat protein